METFIVLVWVAVLQTAEGHISQVDNISVQSDCDRIVQRFVAANKTMMWDAYRTSTRATGECTQYNKVIVVPKQQIIEIKSTPPVIKNNIIVKKD